MNYVALHVLHTHSTWSFMISLRQKYWQNYSKFWSKGRFCFQEIQISASDMKMSPKDKLFVWRGILTIKGSQRQVWGKNKIFSSHVPMFPESISFIYNYKGGRAFGVFWTYNWITQEPDVRSWSNFAFEALFCHLNRAYKSWGPPTSVEANPLNRHFWPNWHQILIDLCKST